MIDGQTWRLGLPSGHNANIVYVGDTKDASGVCIVSGAPQCTTVDELAAMPRYREAYERGCLIAAAPDLLAACEMFVDENTYGVDLAKSFARVAIKKARKPTATASP